MWLQLGGHSEGEVDLFTVALREAQEESGISNFTPLSNQIFDLEYTYYSRAKESSFT